ncbi:DNA polymerase III subunit beta [Candidatus Amarolinea dominans]|uniref:DNA polymerase III subunit beta n=1 Tax=Candidatus Amarolinea dominans TaxID=3140696 RepID=UPI001DFAD732|nr:DNA polymerase III subunit beta [Anaerolineae bacterium]MBK7201645.1 DNA polymerase III subunit beta [Anaerolineae bacterium]
MRISCLQENLAKGLSIVGRAVSSRSTLPVLSNILLATDQGQLKLAATNLEIGINCWIGAKVEDEGAITVPTRILTEFVNSLPTEKIDLDLAVRTQTLNLKCARYEANFKGIDAAEFPTIPTMADRGETAVIELPPATLRQMINQVAFAASTDESRPTLTGVEVRFEEERLTMAATDGYRLARRSGGMGMIGGTRNTVIVPARTLSEVARIVSDASDERPVEVTITPTRNQIMFHVWGRADSKGGYHQVDIVSQLLDATFPDYNAIVPRGFKTRAVLDTQAFLRTVRMAFLFARDAANAVRLQIIPADGLKPGTLTITATSAELGDNVSEMDALVEGEANEIAFNAKYLIDALSAIDTPQVALEATRSTLPGVIRPVGTGPEDYTQVIMPMQLQK